MYTARPTLTSAILTSAFRAAHAWAPRLHAGRRGRAARAPRRAQVWWTIGRLCEAAAVSDPRTQLRQLFDAHGQQVYRRALRILGNPADAEEAMQEVFIRAAKHLADLQQGDQIRWLYRTTTNFCLNLIRDQKRRRELLEARGPGPAVDARSPDALMTLRALLAQADAQEAQAITYVYIDQLPQPEAADLMGVSVRKLAYLLAAFRTWAKART